MTLVDAVFFFSTIAGTYWIKYLEIILELRGIAVGDIELEVVLLMAACKVGVGALLTTIAKLGGEILSAVDELGFEELLKAVDELGVEMLTVDELGVEILAVDELAVEILAMIKLTVKVLSILELVAGLLILVGALLDFRFGARGDAYNLVGTKVLFAQIGVKPAIASPGLFCN